MYGKADSVSEKINRYKRDAAAYAVRTVESGMIVGLGHGTTAREAINSLADRLRLGELHDVQAVPCSEESAQAAGVLGIPLTSLEAHPVIDLVIDGADEVTGDLFMIKGGGGALLHERIVEQASRRVLIVIDASKLSPNLGTRARLPIEVVPFGWRSQALFLESLGARWTLRQEGDAPFLTVERNYILDADFGPIPFPDELASVLQARAGIVTHGLFLHLADAVIMAGRDGIQTLTRSSATPRVDEGG